MTSLFVPYRVRAFSSRLGSARVFSKAVVSLNVADKSTYETTSATEVNGVGTTTSSSSHVARFGDLLAATNLHGHLKHAHDLPNLRTVTPNDVFCNRELKMSHIRAIGFDMDYTLAQYQQPAFDQLAFDGAKAKLVEKLGYPKEVLDFEYDHEVGMYYIGYMYGVIFFRVNSPDFLLFVLLALDTRTHH